VQNATLLVVNTEFYPMNPFVSQNFADRLRDFFSDNVATTPLKKGTGPAGTPFCSRSRISRHIRGRVDGA
jgi:hypothetical protein